ncbi:MAG: response regulator transcription factor [Eubacteriaceae bacterium]
MKILICDDEKEIVEALELYLKNEGYGIRKAYSGKEAIDILKKEEVHLVIMDIMMPEMDGLRATAKIREEHNIPIIFLSAKSEDTDKIMGLTMGGDDYVTKPFNPMEVIARVKSQLRRYTMLGGCKEKPGAFITGGLILEDDYKKVTVDGEEVKLTPVEYGILFFLMREMGKVFSIDQIYENVWEEPSYQSENTVAVHIRRIREKIEINPKEPKYLKVVWGIGYKIERYAKE